MYKRKRTPSTYSNQAYKKPRFTSSTVKRAPYNNYKFTARSFGNPLAISERKYFDSELSASAIVAVTTSWAGSELDPATLSLFNPINGTDFNNRVGRKLQVKSLKIRGFINVAAQTNQAAVDSSALIRCLLVMDKQTNAAQLNGEDVISSGAASVATAMFQNPAFFGRFRVMKDKRWVIQNPSVSWDGTNIEQAGLIKPFEWIVKFRKPLYVHYNGTNGGTVADVIDHSFHLIAGTTNTDLAPTMSYKCRTTFIDV